MNYNRNYTSTGDKLLHHPRAVSDLRAGRSHPIVLHIMPTERCNLRCEFCSVANRGNRELDVAAICQTVKILRAIGLKAVILSGGGEPLLYSMVKEMIQFCCKSGLEIALITNGILLADLDSSVLSKFKWIRISGNTLDYADDVEIPKVPGATLGFSYVWHAGTDPSVLEAIRIKASECGAAYVRLIPDCNLPDPEFSEVDRKIRNFVARVGHPFFRQDKLPKQAGCCYLGYVHPVLYADGYVYPCDSLVLNSIAGDRSFHEEYSLCHWSGIEQFYGQPIGGSLVDVHKCPRCVFTRNNDLLARIIETRDELPPVEEVEHANFI